MSFSFKRETRVQNKHNQPNSAGFLLPVVIFLGIGIGTVSVVALQSVANNSTTLNTQYYDLAAREAAQAGIASAAQCIKASDRSWSEDADATTALRPDTGCDGKVVSGRSAYVVAPEANLPYVSFYEVGNLQVPSTNTVVVTAVGTVKIKGPTSGNYVSTTTSTVRTFARSAVTPTGYVSKEVESISTGPTTACTTAEGWAYCWGSNANKQLGNGKNVEDDIMVRPIAVASNSQPQLPDPGVGHTTCVLIFCSTTYNPKPTPAQPASAMAGKKVTKISVGTTHTCAVATDNDGSNGRAYCWGDNSQGQLGVRGSVAESYVPLAVDTGPAIPAEINNGQCGGLFQRACNPAQPASSLINKNIADITAGDGFTCASTTDGVASCWGVNNRGQLGNDSRTDSKIPTAVSVGAYEPAVVKVCVAWFLGFCTAYNPPSDIPAKPASALRDKAVKSFARIKNASTMCVITTEDKSVCWGQNFSGQTGAGGSISPSNSGNGSDRQGNPNACPQAIANAIADAKRNAPVSTTRDALRPVETQTGLLFDKLTISSNLSDDDSSGYSYVVGKTTGASASPNRTFYWGGTMTTSTTTSCRRNSDSVGGDHAMGSATITRTYSGVTTPTGPLYNTASAGPLNGLSMSVVSGNAVNGLFCAQTTTNVTYCDTHSGSNKEGQTGNGTVVTCSTNFLNQTTCSPTIPSGPQPVKLSGSLSGKLPIDNMDTGSSGYTCAVAAKTVYCWGVNSSGQLGTNNKSNRFEPTPVYLDPPSELGVPSSSSGSTVWGDPINF